MPGWALLLGLFAWAEEPDALKTRLEQLWSEQRFDEALVVAEERTQQASAPLERAEALFDQAWVEMALRRFEAAELHLTESHTLKVEALGTHDPQSVRGVVALGQLDKASGDFLAAVSHYEAARDLHLEAGRPLEAAQVSGWCLALLAERGWHAEAAEHGRQALALREAHQGTEHPRTLNTRVFLASTLGAAGEVDEAEEHFAAALAAFERSGDTEAQALTLKLRGEMLSAAGHHRQALPLHERSLQLRRSRGATPYEIGLALYDLAAVYRGLGRFEDARAALEESQTLLVDAGSAMDQALVLSRLGALERSVHDLGAALTATEQSLAIAEKELGDEHPLVAQLRNDLAMVLGEVGDHERAIALLQRSLEDTKQALGSAHRDVATLQEHLGHALLESGRPEEARSRYETALAIRKALHGEQHRDVARTMGNLSLALLDLDRPDEAVVLERRATAIVEATVGAEHPDMDIRLNNLAYALEELGEHEEAVTLYQRSLALARKDHGPDHPLVAAVLTNLASAQRRAGQLDAARTSVDEAMGIRGRGLAQLGALSDVEAGYYLQQARGTWNVWVALHDQPTDALELWGWMLTFQGAGTASLEQRLAGARASQDPQLVQLWQHLGAVRRQLARQTYARGGPEREAALAELTAEKERLERSLPPQQQASRAPPAPQQVCDALQPGEVLVDLLEHGQVTDRDYLAIVVDARCAPLRIDLGSAAELDALAQAWSEALAVEHPSEPGRGERLAELLFKPLAEELAGAERLLVVPDGALAGVPWAALPVDGGRLVERLESVQLPSVRSLIAPRTEPGRGLLTVGGVSYAEAADCLPTAPLPGTLEESSRLQRAWRRGGPVVALSGTEATPAAVLEAAAGRRAVHLATHGFFAEDQCWEVEAGTSRSPMLRSGLVLAGEDPVLTAEDIAAVDLRGTELVLLSACETARGETRAGEGVLGLQRGFALAGADAVVMSLWSVPDAETATLMQQLMRSLGRRVAVPTALRQAQLAQLRRARLQLGEDAPASWAAWVVSGR